jgi:hypothetical protein
VYSSPTSPIWLKIKYLATCQAMPNKWRARTSRGKKKNNKPRTNAERDQHRSEAALADRETKRQARIQAKKDTARAAAQAKANEVTARVVARRIDPPAAKWAAKPKRGLPQPLPAPVAVPQPLPAPVAVPQPLPKPVAVPKARLRSRPHRIRPAPSEPIDLPQVLSLAPVVALTDPYETDNLFQ